MIEVGGRCDVCKLRASGWLGEASRGEFCKEHMREGATQQFETLPEDVEHGYAMTEAAAKKLDALCDNSKLAQITLYEVYDDGGAYIWVKATEKYSHGIELYIRPNGDLEPTL